MYIIIGIGCVIVHGWGAAGLTKEGSRGAASIPQRKNGVMNWIIDSSDIDIRTIASIIFIWVRVWVLSLQYIYSFLSIILWQHFSARNIFLSWILIHILSLFRWVCEARVPIGVTWLLSRKTLSPQCAQLLMWSVRGERAWQWAGPFAQNRHTRCYGQRADFGSDWENRNGIFQWPTYF